MPNSLWGPLNRDPEMWSGERLHEVSLGEVQQRAGLQRIATHLCILLLTTTYRTTSIAAFPLDFILIRARSNFPPRQAGGVISSSQLPVFHLEYSICRETR